MGEGRENCIQRQGKEDIGEFGMGRTAHFSSLAL